MIFIRHITLTTGHARDSFPGEVSGRAIEQMRQLIDRVVTGEAAESVSLQQYAAAGPYSVSGRAASKCLVLSVYHDGPPAALICTIGVAAHSRCGAVLWRNLHRWGTVPVVTDPDQCPPEPWVASALDEGAIDHADAMHWLGDFERCIAWAWVTRQ